jgi:hypothetical protein
MLGMFPSSFFRFLRLIISPLLFTHVAPLFEVCCNPDQSECCHIPGLWDFICDLGLGRLHSKEVALRIAMLKTKAAMSQGKKT